MTPRVTTCRGPALWALLLCAPGSAALWACADSKPMDCEPGAQVCFEDILYLCDDDRQWAAIDCTEEDMVCTVDQCVIPPADGDDEAEEPGESDLSDET